MAEVPKFTVSFTEPDLKGLSIDQLDAYLDQVRQEVNRVRAHGTKARELRKNLIQFQQILQRVGVKQMLGMEEAKMVAAGSTKLAITLLPAPQIAAAVEQYEKLTGEKIA